MTADARFASGRAMIVGLVAAIILTASLPTAAAVSDELCQVPSGEAATGGAAGKVLLQAKSLKTTHTGHAAPPVAAGREVEGGGRSAAHATDKVEGGGHSAAHATDKVEGGGGRAANAIEKAPSVSKDMHNIASSPPAHDQTRSRPEAPPKLSPASLLASVAGQAQVVAESSTTSLIMLGLAVVLLMGATYATARNQEALSKLFLHLNFLGEAQTDAGRKLDSNLDSQLSPPTEETCFCPDLVVPAGCECILLVPSRPKRGESFDVTDNNGSTVLSIVDKPNSSPPRRMLVAGGNVVLAQCGRAQSSLPSSLLSNIGFELLTAKEDAWAHLSVEPREGAEDKCNIQTKTGEQLFVAGSVRHNALNMTDAHGGLVATTELMTQQGPKGEAAGSLFRLRVAPGADVGLVLCSLICVQHLSTAA